MLAAWQMIGTLSDEEREVLIEGLECIQRRLRDNVRPRPNRSDSYDHADARRYYLAEELIDRLRLS